MTKEEQEKEMEEVRASLQRPEDGPDVPVPMEDSESEDEDVGMGLGFDDEVRQRAAEAAVRGRKRGGTTQIDYRDNKYQAVDSEDDALAIMDDIWNSGAIGFQRH